MLTRVQLDELAAIRDHVEFYRGARVVTLYEALIVALKEIEDQRAVVIAALRCAGEDEITDLVVTAEDYLAGQANAGQAELASDASRFRETLRTKYR